MIKKNYIPYEKYIKLKDANRLGELNLKSEKAHQELCRLSLIDNLVNEFEWHYWMVVTFGFNPGRSETEIILRTAHHRFDQWFRENQKISYMSLAQRSKWVCLPERGKKGYLHYNCFLQLNVVPEIKNYRDEWNTVYVALDSSFSKVGKTKNKAIEFKFYKRTGCEKNFAIYSTKEMTQSFIDKNPNEDHFSRFFRSWKDWEVKPLTKRKRKIKISK